MKTTEINNALVLADITLPDKIKISTIKKALENASTYKAFRFLTELGSVKFDAAEHITDSHEELVDYIVSQIHIDEEVIDEKNGLKQFFEKAKNKADINSNIELPNFAKKRVSEEKKNVPKSFEEAKALYKTFLDKDNVEYLSKYKGCSSLYNISSENKIYFTAKKTAVDITQTDNIWLKFCTELNPAFFIIAENNNETAGEALALGSFLKDEEHDDQYFLDVESGNNNIKPNSKKSYFLLFSDITINRMYAVEITLISSELSSDNTNYLCIDFGTSNTTAGTWKDDNGKKIIELVKFDDVTKENKKTSYLYPSIAYIKKADTDENGKVVTENIEMLFGYAAKKEFIDKDYDPNGSIFFNIKQWISAGESDEVSCTDENGDSNRFKLPVRYIMERYLRKVVDYSEMKLKRHFTKLHFTAPVKWKSLFNEIVTDIFKEYNVLTADESLDEATAVMYKTISRWREEQKNSEGKVFVIDCGGGTTDVALCDYKFEETPAGIKTTIHTKFENGQNNFGGNDITYRIFQLLKIKLCSYYHGQPSKSVDELIGSEGDYLTEIDNCIASNSKFDYYELFDKESSEAEWTVPTDFANKDFVNGDPIEKKARRNFNYLWQWAEKIKIEFYSNLSRAEYRFSDESIKIDDKDKPFYLFVDKDGKKEATKMRLPEINDVPKIEINNNELKTLLSPQIYYILSLMLIGADRKMLPISKENYKLKLTGQSCNISLFNELLKEFICGKRLRSASSGRENNVETLKLACIEGSIGYLMDRNYGAAETEMITDIPSILYKVTTDTGDRAKEEMLFDGAEISSDDSKIISEYGVICRPFTGEKFRYNIYNNIIGGQEPEKSGIIDRTVTESSAQYSIEELEKAILKTAVLGFDEYKMKDDDTVIKCLINELERSEKKAGVFYIAVPNKDGCGFVLWQIIKIEQDNVVHYCAENSVVYYQAVNDIRSYFDGKNCKIDKEDN